MATKQNPSQPVINITGGGKARMVEDQLVDVNEMLERERDPYAALVGWIVTRMNEWRQFRDSNFSERWDEYERLWRGIYSTAEKSRVSERSRLIAPALSEAVENTVAEIEEALFGRGDFFDIKGERDDDEEMKKAVEKNKINLREDLARTDFVPNVAEVVLNGAVYGTGIGEIIIEEKVYRDVVPIQDPTGEVLPSVEERRVACAVLRSVNPRNFLIDPTARTVDTALGCAVEEYVGVHLLHDGIKSGTYRNVPVEKTGGDVRLLADSQTTYNEPGGKAHVFRYYGLVPKALLYPKRGETDPLASELPSAEADSEENSMVEAVVVIVNQQHCLKAVETPYLMRDRPIVAFPWDLIPGRFWGRGVCEKGATPQKALDAELRARIDALAFSAAPMMAMDATRLPRGFSLDVYPGKSVLTNGDPNNVLRPMKFGELDQNTWQQAMTLDQMVQRATGSLDAVALAQRGVGGEARSGAVSMSLSGVVKRHKRTLMNFIDRFLMPALQKLLWRNMQYSPHRYLPINFTFVMSNTMGIMQREYETAQLIQLIQTMQPNTPEYRVTLMGIVANTGLTNRLHLVNLLNEAIERDKQLQQQQLLAGQQAAADPMQQQLQAVSLELQIAEAQAKIAELRAKTAKLTAETQLLLAKTRTESIKPDVAIQEAMMKGIYNVPEEQMQAEFDRRLKLAELAEKEADRESNERIAAMQSQAAVLRAALDAGAEVAAAQAAPTPVPAPAPVPVPPPAPMPMPMPPVDPLLNR